jgi:hypothetical protein
LVSYIKTSYAEPPALAARRREAEEAKAATERKRLEAERSASRSAAAEIVLANLGAEELEAAKVEVKKAMGTWFKGEDEHIFQSMLRAKALERQEMAA